jgi:serine/threonine protein kinase
MGPERWQQISGIFKSALALQPEARGSFVAAQCGADESLRLEVERLIASHSQADNEDFIAGPAVAEVADLLIGESEAAVDSLESGQQLGHYRVLKKLGAGGMGEVYLAADTRLDRTVALKILPADVAADKRRMQRFKQEAKLASALNQPNILTIFEFGDDGSLHFIASEHVDGATLRDHLRTRQLKLGEMLDISTQVVAALDAAHEAKIVHRDIKPENIMVRRRDGVVKVLDFGLAKLSEPRASTAGESDAEANTELLLRTTPGTVIGTVSYMSPEQAQGLRVDERTDLWSMGIVMYEMVAGHAPFAGVTSSHIIVEILEKEAPRLGGPGSDVPPELQRIVGKALAKNPDERYQTAKDLLIDLRNLKKRLEVDAELGRSVSPHSDAVAATGKSGVPSRTEETAARTTEPGPGASEPSQRLKLLPIVGLLLVVVALLIVAANWSRFRRSPATSSAPVAVTAPERKLTYWMMVQKYRNGRPFEDPFRLAHEINFEPDYQVKLNISSPQAGHLYILNQGPPTSDGSSSFVVLFPSTSANHGSSYLAEHQEVEIPPQSWFKFDAEEGTEKLWLVFSEHPSSELEAVTQFANPKDRGLLKDPILQARVAEFLAGHSNAATTIENDEELKQTTLTITGDVLVHAINLEHH